MALPSQEGQQKPQQLGEVSGPTVKDQARGQTTPILGPQICSQPCLGPSYKLRILLSGAASMLCQHTQPKDGIAPHLRVCLPGGAQQHREQPRHKLG